MAKESLQILTEGKLERNLFVMFLWVNCYANILQAEKT